MQKMIVAIWAVDTQAMQNASLLQRMNALVHASEAAYTNITKHLGALGKSLGDRPMGLFVVPEYFLAHPVTTGHHRPGDNRHLEEDEKSNLLAQLMQISKDKCKGVVMVPGTVAWRKPIMRDISKTKNSRTGIPKPLSRQENAVKSVTRYAEDMNIAQNQRLANALGSKNAPTTQDKLALLNSGDAGPLINFSSVDFLARNTSYVLLDGDIKVKYNKRGDFHEVLENDRTVFIPGVLDGRFHVQSSPAGQRAISFGLEICLDHAFGTVQRTTPHYGQVDIHIITSASVSENVDNLIAKEGGYIVHACSRPDASSVKYRKGGMFGPSVTECKSIGQVVVDGFQLKLWDIDLDLSIRQQ